MPLHTDDFIKLRRERVASLLAKGVSPRAISDTLRTKIAVIHSDIRYLNQENEEKMFEMAKQTIPTLYMNCLNNLNELTTQCWNMYVRSNMKEKRDPEGEKMRDEYGNTIEEMVHPIDRISQHTRVEALRLAGELTDKKFNMIQNGPAVFELKKLEQQVKDLRNGIELSDQT